MRAGRAGILQAAKRQRKREEESKKSAREILTERQNLKLAKYGLVKNPLADKENINANNPLFVK